MNSTYFTLFLEEANELWPEGWHALEENAADWQAVFLRVAHTLKGMAGTMGYGAMADVLHRCEDEARARRDLDALRDLWQHIGAALDRATSTQAEAPLKQYQAPRSEPATPAPAKQPHAAASATRRDERGADDIANQAISEIPAPARAPLTASTYLRIDVDRLETMFETIGQLQTRLRILGQADYGSPAWDREMRNVQSLATRSVHHIAGVRLSSLKPLAELFERSLRDASGKSGKPVRFFAKGVNLRIAREVVERLRPLVPHIARNAVVHGIESADVRGRSGKPAEGNLEFSATQDGAFVQILIRDDGGGVQLDGLRLKAEALGLDPRQPEAELLQLLFRSGFSTKASADELAGRGVGLDAVKEAIESAGGEVAVRQEQGQFFELRLRVPVPLSQQRVVELDVDGRRFGVLDDEWQQVEAAPDTLPVARFTGVAAPTDGVTLANAGAQLRVSGWRNVGAVHVHRLTPPLDRLPGAVGFYLDESGVPRLVLRPQ